MRTWTEILEDGRTVSFAAIADFQHWVIEGTERRALLGLRNRLRLHGRDDLVPQLGLAD